MRYVYVIGKPLTKQSMLKIWLEPISPLSYSEILINTMKKGQIKTVVTVSQTMKYDTSTFCCYMVCFRRSQVKGNMAFLSMFLQVLQCCTKYISII